MPATTRNASKQLKLEDVGAGTTETETRKPAASDAGKKRKARSNADGEGPSKRSKKAGTKIEESAEQGDNVITINRAPVLELWASCVAQALRPELSKEACQSIGAAIATITAISKGRSIGTMEKPDPAEAKPKRAAQQDDLNEVQVMSFRLTLDKSGHAAIGNKPKKPNEEALRKKYGGSEQYDKAKATFQDALQAWKRREDELQKQAFGFYEAFRPSIPSGQKGWGRKGQLRLQTVRDVVAG